VDECKPLPAHPHRVLSWRHHAPSSGLTLVHFLAQHKQVLWERMSLWVELVTLNGSG